MCSNGLIRSIGKVFLVLGYSTLLEIHYSHANWHVDTNCSFGGLHPTLDNNNGVFITFYTVSMLYTKSHTPRRPDGMPSCISIVISVLKMVTHLATTLQFGSFSHYPVGAWDTRL